MKNFQCLPPSRSGKPFKGQLQAHKEPQSVWSVEMVLNSPRPEQDAHSGTAGELGGVPNTPMCKNAIFHELLLSPGESQPVATILQVEGRQQSRLWQALLSQPGHQQPPCHTELPGLPSAPPPRAARRPSGGTKGGSPRKGGTWSQFQSADSNFWKAECGCDRGEEGPKRSPE